MIDLFHHKLCMLQNKIACILRKKTLTAFPVFNEKQRHIISIFKFFGRGFGETKKLKDGDKYGFSHKYFRILGT